MLLVVQRLCRNFDEVALGQNTVRALYPFHKNHRGLAFQLVDRIETHPVGSVSFEGLDVSGMKR